MSRILRAEIVEMGGPLGRPARNANHRWLDRAGLLFRLVDDRGRVGLGEASPLPGYSHDTIEGSRRALERFIAEPPAALDEDTPIEAQVRSRLAMIAPSQPAARFALETALLDLAGQERGQPLHALLREGDAAPIRSSVPVSALVDGSSEAQMLADLASARARGLGTVKLKLSRDFARDLELLAALRQAAGEDIAIRLDANGSFPVDEAADRLGALSSFAPEFIEEPVRAADLPRLAAELLRSGRARAWSVPLAVDESLQDAEDPGHVPAALQGLIRSGTVSVLVLKPMALGGLYACLDLALVASDLGAAAIVTHLFDGPVALAAAAALALALPSPSDGRERSAGVARAPACGLDPHAALTAFPDFALHCFAGGCVVPGRSPGLGVGVGVGVGIGIKARP